MAAVELILTREAWAGDGRPPAPSLRIEVAGTRPQQREQIEVAVRRPPASQRVFARAAWVSGEPGARPVWLTGALNFVQDSPPALGVEASFRLCEEAGRCFGGTASAPWRDRRAPCG